jgi:hypothetical protein
MPKLSPLVGQELVLLNAALSIIESFHISPAIARRGKNLVFSLNGVEISIEPHEFMKSANYFDRLCNILEACK